MARFVIEVAPQRADDDRQNGLWQVGFMLFEYPNIILYTEHSRSPKIAESR
jgi:hypothetical protein